MTFTSNSQDSASTSLFPVFSYINYNKFTSISNLLSYAHINFIYPVINEIDHITVKLFPATFSTGLHSTTVRIPFSPLLLYAHLKSENGCSSQYQFIFNRILHFVPLVSDDGASNRLQNGIWVHLLSHNTTNTFLRQGWVV
jgi:hypothetical protein